MNRRVVIQSSCQYYHAHREGDVHLTTLRSLSHGGSEDTRFFCLNEPPKCINQIYMHSIRDFYNPDKHSADVYSEILPSAPKHTPTK